MKSYVTIFLSVLLILLIVSSTTYAQIPDLIQESFLYPDGTYLDAQGDSSGGWGGPWELSTGEDGEIICIGGTVPLDEVPIYTEGRYVEVSTDGADMTIYRSLADTMLDTGEDFWISFLYQRLESDSYSDDSYNGLSLYMGSTELLYIGKPWATEYLGVAAHNATGDVVVLEASSLVGAWMVVKFEMNGDQAARDSAFLFLDPDPNVEPDIAEADGGFQWVSENGWDRFRIGCNNACWAAFDEIKVAKNYADLNRAPNGIFTSPVGNLPYKYALAQNYPNPFNPVTTFSYNVPTTSQVKIIVFDVLGREIATLVNEEKMPGTYQASFDGTNLTSGIYFYQMQAGPFIQTKKMMLVK